MARYRSGDELQSEERKYRRRQKELEDAEARKREKALGRSLTARERNDISRSLRTNNKEYGRLANKAAEVAVERERRAQQHKGEDIVESRRRAIEKSMGREITDDLEKGRVNQKIRERNKSYHDTVRKENQLGQLRDTLSKRNQAADRADRKAKVKAVKSRTKVRGGKTDDPITAARKAIDRFKKNPGKELGKFGKSVDKARKQAGKELGKFGKSVDKEIKKHQKRYRNWNEAGYKKDQNKLNKDALSEGAKIAKRMGSERWDYLEDNYASKNKHKRAKVKEYMKTYGLDKFEKKYTNEKTRQDILRKQGHYRIEKGIQDGIGSARKGLSKLGKNIGKGIDNLGKEIGYAMGKKRPLTKKQKMQAKLATGVGRSAQNAVTTTMNRMNAKLKKKLKREGKKNHYAKGIGRSARNAAANAMTKANRKLESKLKKHRVRGVGRNAKNQGLDALKRLRGSFKALPKVRIAPRPRIGMGMATNWINPMDNYKHKTKRRWGYTNGKPNGKKKAGEGLKHPPGPHRPGLRHNDYLGEVLEHYGIPGMKWGQRRLSARSAARSATAGHRDRVKDRKRSFKISRKAHRESKADLRAAKDYYSWKSSQRNGLIGSTFGRISDRRVLNRARDREADSRVQRRTDKRKWKDEKRRYKKAYRAAYRKALAAER